MEQLDTVVVGAGVVGLAIGRALAESGRGVTVLEAEPQVGMHCSSRNSEVIHAGLYYPEHSLKAQLCVRGKELLYAYCKEHEVRHDRIGKLIVATSDNDLAKLTAIEKCAQANGVIDLQRLSAEKVKKLEPCVQAVGALHSPSTGIVDSHHLMMALQADIENAGGFVVLNSHVSNVTSVGGGVHFETSDSDFHCKTLVNSASLWAQALVKEVGELKRSAPAIRYAIGHYFSYEGRSPFHHLIYPVPSGGGLGIHATNDLGNIARFGPDLTWIDDIDYAFDETRKRDFVAAIKKYFPDLDERKLQPAYTGIRPKLHGPGETAGDFVIQGEVDHGVRGLVNLFGIDSPGLTSALAIAAYVTNLL